MNASCSEGSLSPITNKPTQRLYPSVLALSVCLIFAFFAWTSLRDSGSMTEAAASELNHHLAGYSLIFMSAIIIASLVSAQCWPLRFVSPLLFISLGFFLAAWSDAEIWPRGPLSWSWLIHHDAEARQHKLYAMILISIGVIEFLRARDRLRPISQRWALPLLAVCGAGLLTMHAHGGTSGLPQDWNPVHPVVAHAAHHNHEQHMTSALDPVPHGHAMTATMLKIQRQHLWMTIAGIVFAVSKFMADSRSSPSRFMQFVWPSAMLCLGALLVMYRE